MHHLLLIPLLLVQDGAGSAPGPGAPAGSPGIVESLFGSMLFPLILCFGVFWLLILRPESKQRKKRLEMLANLKKGDKVQTNGGLLGTVVQVQDSVVTLQVDEGVRLRFAQSAIGTVLDEDGAPASDKK
ncbi:MAG: preprotein translocase subunit YajC [Planctomycetota bacterium]|nr:preprotein translocase subunit YajC [Planctomycetota bacterium]